MSITFKLETDGRSEAINFSNGNAAALVSTFGKIEGTGEYVFFVVDTRHAKYECVKKIDTSGVRRTAPVFGLVFRGAFEL